MNSVLYPASVGILIALLLSFLFSHPGINITNTGGHILMKALNFLDGGLPPTRSEHGPILPASIALGYLISGEEVSHVLPTYTVTSFYYILSYLGIYLLGRVVFGHWVGFLAVLFGAYTELTIHQKSMINADFPMLAFMLLGFWLFTYSCTKKNLRLSAISGFLLALATLSKESMWLGYLGFPFLLVFLVKDFHPLSLKILGAWLVGFLATLVPWELLSLSMGHPFLDFLGVLAPGKNHVSHVGISSQSEFVQLTLTTGLPSALRVIAENTGGWIWFVYFGWLAFFVRLFRYRSQKDVIFFSLFLCVLPMLAAFGVWKLDLYNTYPFLFLGFIAFSKFVFDLSSWIYERSKAISLSSYLKPLVQPSTLTLATGLICVFLYVSEQRFTLKPQWQGRMESKVIDAALWAKKSIGPNKLLCVGGYFDHSIRIITEDKFRYKNCYPSQHKVMDYANGKEWGSKGTILEFRSRADFRDTQSAIRQHFYALHAEDMKHFIQMLRTEPHWYFFYNNPGGRPFNTLNNYIKNIGQKVFSNQYVDIYELLPEDVIEFDEGQFQPNSYVISDLNWLKSKKPEYYRKYIRFFRKLGVDKYLEPSQKDQDLVLNQPLNQNKPGEG